MSRKVIQQLLEALQNCANGEDDVLLTREALSAGRQALAKPEPEPVATVIKKGAERQWMSEKLSHLPDGIYSLYTTPPQRQPLTRKKIDEMAEEGSFLGNIYEITCAVEFEHNIKEQS